MRRTNFTGLHAEDAVFDTVSLGTPATVDAIASPDAAAAVGAAPTKEEFDAVVALANELKGEFNALQAMLLAAGAITKTE